MPSDKMAGYFLQGILSYTGVGGTVDLKSAYNYFSRSGDAMSKSFAAYMQFTGKGTPKDKKKGAILFTRYKKVLQQADDPFVDWLIGMMYLEGIDVPKDDVKAFERFSKAAEKDNSLGLFHLGLLYGEGRGTEKDPAKSYELIERAAKQNLMEAVYEQAMMLQSGKGVEKDKTEAVNLIMKAAEGNLPEAQFDLAWKCIFGNDVQQDVATGVKWMEKAAQNGHMFAQFNLGEFYGGGNYVEKDADKGLKWMIAAGEQGCLEAQIDLAELYLYENDDVKRDPELAFYWYDRAAKQGDKESLTTVGRMYSLGEGVKQNAIKATEILVKRAEDDDELAEFYLGEMYDQGLGVRKNIDEAKKWYKKAADHGHAEAKIRYAIMVNRE